MAADSIKTAEHGLTPLAGTCRHIVRKITKVERKSIENKQVRGVSMRKKAKTASNRSYRSLKMAPLQNKEAKAKVTSPNNQVDPRVFTKLSEESFKTFCDDVSGMFGVNIQCNRQQVSVETSEGLKKHFKEPVAVHCVKAEGALEGTFYLVFDRDGLFTLAGVINMRPEEMILEDINFGSPEKAKETSNLVTEVGEALVGAWDRTFSKGFAGHSRFVQTDIFIGSPWGESGTTDVFGGKELMLIPYEMTVEPFPAFKCGAIFAKELFTGTSEAHPKQAAPVEQADGKKNAIKEDDSKESATALQNGGEEPKPQELNVKEAASAKTVAGKDTRDAEKIVSTTAETEDAKSVPISETIRKMVRSADASATQPTPSSPAEKPGIRIPEALSAICAKDLMQKEVLWCTANESMKEAFAKMQQHNAGYIMTGQSGVLEGIVSKSDLKGASSPYLRPEFSKWRRAADYATLQIKLKWIMSKPVRTIRPETPLTEIMENMRRFGIRGLPVVDHEGIVQGLVTVFDVFKALLTSGPDASTTNKADENR